VKKTLALVACLAALGVAVCGDVTSWAQAQVAPPPGQPPVAQPPRPPQTRIGMVNMVYVLKNYRKFQNVEAEIKNHEANLVKAKLEPFRTQLVSMKTIHADPKTLPAQREQIEREAKTLQLKAQDTEADVRKELSQRSGDAYRTIYKDVELAAQRFAASNNYEMVLFFNDAITDDDKNHPANIQRKLLQPAAVMPLYITPGMDVSKPIVDMLNQMYPAAAPAPVAPPAGQPGVPNR
jgi:Skp family chaperone for outer membrane proteins